MSAVLSEHQIVTWSMLDIGRHSVWRNPKSERNRIRNFFPIPNFFDTESDTFSDTDFFPIPIPILFSIPKFYETDTNTFFDTKFFRNRYQYFFSKPKFFETETDTFSIPVTEIVVANCTSQFNVFYLIINERNFNALLLEIPKFHWNIQYQHLTVEKYLSKHLKGQFRAWLTF